jgi:ubiquinol-cytochrome c reductase iron-sulfur subunit
MTDSNAPGQPDDPGRPRQGDDLMADLAAAGPAPREAPHRVVGTPPPAEARSMLAPAPEEVHPPARELPADPQDEEGAKRAEKVVAACFVLATLAGLGFIACYFIFNDNSVSAVTDDNLALGSCMSGAFLLLAIGATVWVRNVMPTVELTEERHPMRSTPENRAAFAETFTEGAEASQFVKRPLMRRTLIAATVPVAIAPIVLLRDMGPLPYKSLDTTVWRAGLRLIVYGTNRPITAAEFNTPGSMVTVIPEGYEDNFDALAKAAVIIIKLAPGELQAPTVMNWTVNDIVAYSKICTHVGCPVALYEQTTHHILCPCHQSTFDATKGAEVVFGPATRPLPQLPMTTDAQGYLVARGDFHEPVGPSFWERS